MLDNTDYLECPKCNQSNTVEFWDRHTKAEAGVGENDPFISSGADMKDHDETQSYFHCPICNEEVDGVELHKHNKKD